jgi:3-dehydroquinate synthase
MIYQGNSGNWHCKIEFQKIPSIINFVESIPNRFIIFDKNVKLLYFNDYQSVNTFTLESSEQNKSFESYEKIISELVNCKIDRNVTIIAIGGGVVCDLAGFVASTYKRGTNLIFVPTTLLAMADAAIGGKNAVNINHVKNLVGTFRMPDRILISTEFLKTLEDDELINGMAEVIKISLVYDSFLFNELEKLLNLGQNISYKTNYLKDIIRQAIELKMNIVEQDYKDNGIRNILNFGHTVGHSIEAGYGISHGRSVAYGMKAAAYMSLEYKLITLDTYENIINILTNFGFILDFEFDSEILMNFILNDKKKKSGHIKEILLKDIGKYEFRNISITDYRKFLNDLC